MEGHEKELLGLEAVGRLEGSDRLDVELAAVPALEMVEEEPPGGLLPEVFELAVLAVGTELVDDDVGVEREGAGVTVFGVGLFESGKEDEAGGVAVGETGADSVTGVGAPEEVEIVGAPEADNGLEETGLEGGATAVVVEELVVAALLVPELGLLLVDGLKGKIFEPEAARGGVRAFCSNSVVTSGSAYYSPCKVSSCCRISSHFCLTVGNLKTV